MSESFVLNLKQETSGKTASILIKKIIPTRHIIITYDYSKPIYISDSCPLFKGEGTGFETRQSLRNKFSVSGLEMGDSYSIHYSYKGASSSERPIRPIHPGYPGDPGYLGRLRQGISILCGELEKAIITGIYNGKPKYVSIFGHISFESIYITNKDGIECDVTVEISNS